jgi:hypothetical protein
MTYNDLIAEIKLLSKRGDIDDKIAVALRQVTLRAHRLDFFWRDHVEANATFASSQNVTIDVSSSLTRFRQVNYIQYYDPGTGSLGNILEEVEPSNVIDNFGYFKQDAWYMSGVNCNVNFAWPSAGARIGYWQNPDVTVAGYNSWIKDELPDLLIQGSLAYLFNLLGKQEEARSLNREVGFDPDPANRAPGMTLCDQLRAIGIRASGSA